jgi:hypothetical protein
MMKFKSKSSKKALVHFNEPEVPTGPQEHYVSTDHSDSKHPEPGFEHEQFYQDDSEYNDSEDEDLESEDSDHEDQRRVPETHEKKQYGASTGAPPPYTYHAQSAEHTAYAPACPVDSLNSQLAATTLESPTQ